MTHFENSRPQLTLVLWTLFIVILYIVLGDGEPILKPGLAICDPCGPKGQTPRETSGGEKKPLSSCHSLSSLGEFGFTRHSSHLLAPLNSVVAFPQ